MKNLILAFGLFLVPFSAIPQESDWKPVEVSTRDFECLVMTLYHEARSESTEGILAVAFVVLNRVESPRYPKSICKVVKQQMVRGVWQFSFWKNKHLTKKPMKGNVRERIERLAQQALDMHQGGFDVSEGSMYYHTKKVKPSWRKSRELRKVRVIGNHIFYKRV